MHRGQRPHLPVRRHPRSAFPLSGGLPASKRAAGPRIFHREHLPTVPFRPERGRMTTIATDEQTDTTPRVWIGSLAAYNEGDLLGDWFDAIDAPLTPEEWVDAMIERRHLMTAVTATPDHRAALARQHEEIWVFDHENFLGLLKGECSPSTAQELAQQLEDQPDDRREAFAAWVGDGNDASTFDDHFEGIYETFRDYLYETVPSSEQFEQPSRWDTGARALHETLQFFERYFDWDAYERDAHGDYSTYRVSDGVAVFSS